MKDHKYITAERIIKNGFVNFGRNVWLAIAAIAMMCITLTILLFAIISNATFTHSINDLTSKIDVVEYLKDDVSLAQADKQMNQLKQLPNVKSVSYTSKNDALKAYEQQNANNPTLLSAISQTDNPLPASITIKPVDPDKLQDIQNFLNKPAQKALQSDATSYSGDRKQAIDKITAATHFFKNAGVIGIIIFIIISMLIIFNTIRMAIFNRRDELIIMRLLGASTAYIRGPFVVETMLYGAVAAGISLIICWSLFRLAASTLNASTLGLLDISYSNSYFSHHLASILTIQIRVGILIGAASSLIATRRYLRLNR
ncbi:MAG TPA: permease-like cell division protein FtsX [Candidatus Saccharimonadales bacterium]|nr:permease-like cell division protein FtsX [Candidatus Saccharimonadales bacterium]